MTADRGSDSLSFGDLLRQHRHAAGLSQEELAERAGMSPRGISDLERSVRTYPYRETARLLAEALGLSGGRPVGVPARGPASAQQRHGARATGRSSPGSADPPHRPARGTRRGQPPPARRHGPLGDPDRSRRRGQDPPGARRGGGRGTRCSATGWSSSISPPCVTPRSSSRRWARRSGCGRAAPERSATSSTTSSVRGRCSCSSTTSNICSRPRRWSRISWRPGHG